MSTYVSNSLLIVADLLNIRKYSIITLIYISHMLLVNFSFAIYKLKRA